MLRHYITMTLRGFIRHKLYSSINVLGLAVALTCAILILLFVRDQLSYDAWIPGTKNLYRLEVTFHMPGQAPLALALSPFPVVTEVGKQIAQVRAVTHVLPEKMTVAAGDRRFAETVTVVDPDFFQLIRLPLREGSPTRVLSQPESIVLSEREAHKYFGAVDPIGKTLRVSGTWNECQPNDIACYTQSHLLTVTGVLRDLPHETQLVADFVVPNTSQADLFAQSNKQSGWGNADGDYGYVELAPDAHPRAVITAIEALLDRSFDERGAGLNEPASSIMQFHLTPFRDVHLEDGVLGGMTPPGNRVIVFGFAIVGILVVLVASFNFMNLATARAMLRAREIALRKLTGAKGHQLMTQFLGESVLTALISLAVALSAVELGLPVFDQFLGNPIALHYVADWSLLAALVGGTVLVGLLSGIYPGIVLSRFRPAVALKAGGQAAQTGSGVLRSALVVGQFAVSIGLAVAAIVVFRQIEFGRAQDWGVDRQNVIVIDGIGNLPLTAREGLQRVLNSGPGIIGTALSAATPFSLGRNVGNTQIQPLGSTGTISAQWLNITPEFPQLYSVHLLAGRYLSKSYGEDMSSDWSGKNVLISLEMARRMGLTPEQAVGKTFEVPGTSLKSPMKIVGVVADVMYIDLRSAARASVYIIDPSQYLSLSVKVRADQLREAESYIDRTLRSFAPNVALSWNFLDESFDGLFHEDEKEGEMFAGFAGVAVLIACLGLFGLVVFTAERSTKEIGIRKISGARTLDVLLLMLWRISVPVLIANLLAWPVAYACLRYWLSGYAYRISLSPLYFLMAGGMALLIAWATVYANTWMLARASPVHALRYE